MNPIHKMLNEFGLSSIIDKVENNSINSVRIKTYCCKEERIKIGDSKLGGFPDLPNNTDWPKLKETPLSFIAQLKLADFKIHDSENLLPESGILYFFYDNKEQPWGFNPSDRGSWKVMYYNGEITSLKRTSPPSTLSDEHVFTPCSIKTSPETTIPPYGSYVFDELGLSDEERDQYFELTFSIDEEGEEPIHKLLGYPNPVQSDMQLECQLVSNGLYCGDETGFEDPKRKELEKGATEWRLLLQVDSDDKMGMMWGDCGRIYYWIKKDDLRNLQFDRTWLILQCS